ncbi:hypothetical protein TNCV_3753061 [Trichonephila clavipes]|nr:hypothetical protein TNCV_3753061 [Trichonephila clavipes]
MKKKKKPKTRTAKRCRCLENGGNLQETKGKRNRQEKITSVIVLLARVSFTCRNCGGGDRGRVAIYRPFGEFHRAKITLSPVWGSRPTTGVPLAHATMNFVGLDLTTSDRWHQKKQQHKEL